MSVRLEGARRVFGENASGEGPGIVDVDLQANDGELLVVVGPSGSGKTTLLRCIAGLEPVDAGRVWVAGRDVTRAAPGRRDVAMVFQDFALYPHLTVTENIAFGLRARRTPPGEVEQKVDRAAGLLGLTGVLARRPNELSGGERQRVALARAIVREPAVFLMDEPLSNLDAELRAQMRAEIRRLQRDLGTTMVYVTHDQVEAMTMGDRVAVLRDGRIEQVDRPMDLYDAPATAFVAAFLGNPPANVLPASVVGGGREGVVAIRPERIRVVQPSRGKLSGRIELVEETGNEAILHVLVDGHRVLVRSGRSEAPAQGARVGLFFRDDDVLRFEAASG